MIQISRFLFIALLFAPVPVVCYISFRLLLHRRSPPGDLWRPWGFGAFRPDRYTDAGQTWLRRLWLLMVLIIPWLLVVRGLFRYA